MYHSSAANNRAFTPVLTYGAVKNTGAAPAVFVNVECDFIGADSSLVDSAFSYIKGDTLSSTNIDITTGTALLPDHIGYFEILTDVKPEDYATLDCDIDWDVVRNMETPKAKLELLGNLTVQEDFFGDVEYLGRVQNTGSDSLVFGKAIIVTKNTQSEIVDITTSYIDGDTIYLSSIDTNTDTGLHSGSTGSFKASWTNIEFQHYGEHILLFSWDDFNDADSAYSGRNIKPMPTIDEMREAYNSANDL